VRISADKRAENEDRVRAVMNRMLSGDLPIGGSCDVKTLARESGLDRTAFYGTRPYARLRAEFEARLQQAAQAGTGHDLRLAQIDRLKCEAVIFNERLGRRDQTITELADFKIAAVSRLAAQHDEITQLRFLLAHPDNVRALPARAPRNIGS